MKIPDVLSLISSRGFLSPKAARYAFLGPDTFVFLAALPHGPGSEEPEDGESAETGRIAPFAQRNFYRTAVLQIQKVAAALRSAMNIRKRDTVIFCNSRLPEKAMAAACGVGRYGKNGLILVPGTGSLCVLAGFSVPFSLFSKTAGNEQEYPLLSISLDVLAGDSFSLCGSCNACRDACPTNALATPGCVDRRKCIQNFTADTSVVPDQIMEQWGTIIYGCQYCQAACPLNRNVIDGIDTREGVISSAVDLLTLLSGGVDTIKRTVRATVMDRKWIPPEALLRNVLIAAGNTRQSRLAPYIRSYLDDSRRYIRYAAVWAYRKTTSTES